MNHYTITVDGMDTYEVLAENAYKAYIRWFEYAHDPLVLEYIAENYHTYKMDIDIKKNIHKEDIVKCVCDDGKLTGVIDGPRTCDFCGGLGTLDLSKPLTSGNVTFNPNSNY